MSTHAPEPGCYVDSRWGQYAIARVVEIALELGWEDAQAPDLVARHLGAVGPAPKPGLTGEELEVLIDASIDAEVWLNAHRTREGFSWGWDEGDFGLYPIYVPDLPEIHPNEGG